jgi:hypothetical protein
MNSDSKGNIPDVQCEKDCGITAPDKEFRNINGTNMFAMMP